MLILTLNASGAASAAPGFLAYGDLRGHIEPCGCDPATDLGGIKRLGAVVQRERSLNQDLALFSLGNNVGSDKPSELKNPFLVESDELLQVTAALANVSDIALLKSGKISYKSGFPLLLSNVSDKSSIKSKVKGSVSHSAYTVFGYTYSDAVSEDVRRVDDQMIAGWKKAAKTPSLLLFSGPKEDLGRIAQAKIFDQIVSSNTQPLSAETSTMEKDDEGRLRRLSDPVVMMVPHGGQGILRGGALLYSEAKPVSEFFKQETDKPKGMDLPFPKAKFVSWLDPTSATDDGPLKGVYDRYTEAARKAFLGESEKRLKDLKDTPYAGNAACASCHADASQIYVKTSHAHAMKTLVDKGKSEDPECVSCHTVGAKEKGGFVSLAASPNLANVQCENCHGPRLAHVKDPKGTPKLPPVKLELCVTCHNSQHSPKFSAADYWKSIAHH